MNYPRNTPITIVGAGAIGGTVGAYLDEAGYDITLVDAEPEHVRVINEQGLRITGVRGERTFRPRAILADELEGPLKAVFLCVKGHFTEDAMDKVEPFLGPDGFVLSLQNGLNEALIAERVGALRTVGAFVHFGADLLEPGLIQLGDDSCRRTGRPDYSPRRSSQESTRKRHADPRNGQRLGVSLGEAGLRGDGLRGFLRGRAGGGGHR